MSALVVDTSVVFKWFYQADAGGVPEAFSILEATLNQDLELHAPASLPLELANALRSSGLPAAASLDGIETLELAHLRLAEMTTSRLRAATELSYSSGMSVYDSLFPALAEELGCPLVTADRKAAARMTTSIEIRLL